MSYLHKYYDFELNKYINLNYVSLFHIVQIRLLESLNVNNEV